MGLVSTLLAERTTLRLSSLDRLLVQSCVPRLQSEGLLVRWMLDRKEYPSPRAFGRAHDRMVDGRHPFRGPGADVPFVSFSRGQRKEDIVDRYERRRRSVKAASGGRRPERQRDHGVPLHMLKLDYALSPSWNACSTATLEDADETSLRYDCFLGDVIFLAFEVDLNARWGWVPVLDFALGLEAVVVRLHAELRRNVSRGCSATSASASSRSGQPASADA